jgi:hypothetical protein
MLMLKKYDKPSYKIVMCINRMVLIKYENEDQQGRAAFNERVPQHTEQYRITDKVSMSTPNKNRR